MFPRRSFLALLLFYSRLVHSHSYLTRARRIRVLKLKIKVKKTSCWLLLQFNTTSAAHSCRLASFMTFLLLFDLSILLFSSFSFTSSILFYSILFNWHRLSSISCFLLAQTADTHTTLSCPVLSFRLVCPRVFVVIAIVVISVPLEYSVLTWMVSHSPLPILSFAPTAPADPTHALLKRNTLLSVTGTDTLTMRDSVSKHLSGISTPTNVHHP